MSTCPRCGSVFDCGMVDTQAAQPCWCTRLPTLPAAALGTDSATCFCPACLRHLLDQPASAASRLMHPASGSD